MNSLVCWFLYTRALGLILFQIAAAVVAVRVSVVGSRCMQ